MADRKFLHSADMKVIRDNDVRAKLSYRSKVCEVSIYVHVCLIIETNLPDYTDYLGNWLI